MEKRNISQAWMSVVMKKLRVFLTNKMYCLLEESLEKFFLNKKLTLTT